MSKSTRDTFGALLDWITVVRIFCFCSVVRLTDADALLLVLLPCTVVDEPDEGAWAPWFCCVVVPWLRCMPEPDCELDDPDWAAFGCELVPLPWPDV